MATLPKGKRFDSHTGGTYVGVLETFGVDADRIAYWDHPGTDDPTVDPDGNALLLLISGYYYPSTVGSSDYRIEYTALPNTPEGKKRYKWEKFLKVSGVWETTADSEGTITEI